MVAIVRFDVAEAKWLKQRLEAASRRCSAHATPSEERTVHWRRYLRRPRLIDPADGHVVLPAFGVMTTADQKTLSDSARPSAYSRTILPPPRRTSSKSS